MADRWRDPEFVAAAHAWIEGRLADLGMTRTGDIEQPHVFAWSTVMRAPTDRGDIWFKANTEDLRHEAAIGHASLLQQLPPELAQLGLCTLA